MVRFLRSAIVTVDTASSSIGVVTEGPGQPADPQPLSVHSFVAVPIPVTLLVPRTNVNYDNNSPPTARCIARLALFHGIENLCGMGEQEALLAFSKGLCWKRCAASGIVNCDDGDADGTSSFCVLEAHTETDGPSSPTIRVFDRRRHDNTTTTAGGASSNEDDTAQCEDVLQAAFLCDDAHISEDHLVAIVPLTLHGRLSKRGDNGGDSAEQPQDRNVVRHYPLPRDPQRATLRDWAKRPPPALLISLEAALREVSYKVGVLPKYGA